MAANVPSASSAPVAQSGILPLFWDLASADEAVRLAAAEKLIQAVVADAGVGKVDASPCTTDDEFFARCPPVTAYTVKRLIRGLPSSREGARQGFTVALTEVRAPVCNVWRAGAAH